MTAIAYMPLCTHDYLSKQRNMEFAAVCVWHWQTVQFNICTVKLC